MEQLDRYNQALEDIFKYFNYDGPVEDVDDYRDSYWYITGEIEIRYQDEPIKMDKDSYWDEAETVYAEEISYHHQWKKGFICRGPEFTMVLIDTCTGDGKRLMIFDNEKEYKEI